MTLRVVVLRDVEGIGHTIPNGSIARVSNKTHGVSRSVLDIDVAYQEDVDWVMQVMRAVAAELWQDEEWKARLAAQPAVWGVQSLAERAVNIRMVSNTVPGRQWEVGRELRRRFKNRFDREGISIPFPQRTLHLGDPDQRMQVLAARGSAAPKA